MNGYKIGAVAKLTGIATNTIRVWERRYEAVVPQRSDSGVRFYDEDNVQRLRLLNALVQRGDAIGQVANLPQDELESRLEVLRTKAADPALDSNIAKQPGQSRKTLYYVGPGFDPRIRNAAAAAFDCQPGTETIAQLLDRYDPDAASVILIEADVVNHALLEAIHGLQQRVTPTAILLLYRHASADDRMALTAANVLLIRQPADADNVQRILMDCLTMEPRATVPVSVTNDSPAPMFSKRQLLTLERMRSEIRCECPQHIAQLLHQLQSFERYSELCADESEDDAALHRMLGRATAQSRHILEQALADLLEQERIVLPDV